jgi:hypothetical protein
MQSRQVKMEFPPEWDVFPADVFDTAAPRDPGDLGVELMAQIRDNGRILDHHKLVLGGAELITVTFNLGDAMGPSTDVPAWKIRLSAWARDIQPRRNMTTTAWIDVSDLLKAKDAVIVDEADLSVDMQEFFNWQATIRDKLLNSCSIRWAVCAGEDGRTQLQLQSLPAPTSSFAGKPLFKG